MPNSIRMNWEDLLSNERLANPNRDKNEQDCDNYMNQYPSGDFDNDYKSIISAFVFRRLQDKTQIFPLDKEDYVRTRLTHSLEVSTVAKQLGVMVTHGIESEDNNNEDDNDEDNNDEDNNDVENNGEVNGKKVAKRLPVDFQLEKKNPEEVKKIQNMVENIPEILACAGLIHDLGNPPFGHFGEDVIREWFKTEKKDGKIKFNGKPIMDVLGNVRTYDLTHFDGNAQAIRILSKADFKPDQNELNLAYSVINTLIKYTDTAEVVDKDSQRAKNVKKLGFYQSEKDIAEKICTTTGTMLKDESKEVSRFCRHPLTYLLEAADDIVYTTDDLEDGVQKGLVSLDQIIQYFKEEIAKAEEDENDKTYGKKPKLKKTETLINELATQKEQLEKDNELGKETELWAFQKWCDYVQKWLMYTVAYTFTMNPNIAKGETQGYDQIMNGTYKPKDLFELGFHKYTIKFLKGVTHKYVHSDLAIEKLELSSKAIIDFLLKFFVHAVIYWEEDEDKMTATDKRLVDILSKRLKEDYKKACSEITDESERLYRRILMVTDFVSGMTDTYARNLYRELNGINEL